MKKKSKLLTPQQAEVLSHCDDWSAAWEVAERRIEMCGAKTDWRKTQDILTSLENRGLVKFGTANQTYRITDAGRAALKEAPHDEG